MGRDEGWTLGDEGNLEEYVLIIIIKMYIYTIIKKGKINQGGIKPIHLFLY